MDLSALVIVTAPRDVALAIKATVDAEQGSSALLVERKNLDGSVPGWVVAATLTVNALPHVLTFVRDLVQSRRVDRIAFEDIEIVNPKAEDLSRLRELIDAKIRRRRS